MSSIVWEGNFSSFPDKFITQLIKSIQLLLMLTAHILWTFHINSKTSCRGHEMPDYFRRMFDFWTFRGHTYILLQECSPSPWQQAKDAKSWHSRLLEVHQASNERLLSVHMLLVSELCWYQPLQRQLQWTWPPTVPAVVGPGYAILPSYLPRMIDNTVYKYPMQK